MEGEDTLSTENTSLHVNVSAGLNDSSPVSFSSSEYSDAEGRIDTLEIKSENMCSESRFKFESLDLQAESLDWQRNMWITDQKEECLVPDRLVTFQTGVFNISEPSSGEMKYNPLMRGNRCACAITSCSCGKETSEGAKQFSPTPALQPSPVNISNGKWL